jgi:Xaa-Pro aminopeptidase
VLSIAKAPGWLAFETLTLFPFDLRLIDSRGLSAAQLSWLNDYHATVLERLAPHLPSHLAAFLAEKCAPL